VSSSLQTSAETDLENASSSDDEPRRKTGRGRRAAGQSLSAAALRKDNLTPVQRRRLRKLADENEAASGASSSQENAVSDDESTGRTRSALRKSTRASSSAPRATRTSRRKTSISEITSEAMAEAAAAAGPMASEAFVRPRHRLLFWSFVVVVMLPLMVSAAYLYGVAKDQYASTVGFSVRREDASSAGDILGGLTSLTKSSSSDTDILYEYLRSQKLVADMDSRVDLRGIWSKPAGDPVFVLDPSGSIEDLVDYWQRMVRTSYDSTTGLIEVRVLAFEPNDATAVAEALLSESARMINDLSAAAREDAVRYSREELTAAEDRLRNAREAVTAYRVKNQIVDPTTDFQTQAGLVGSLENQLAEAQIEIDLLAGVADNDPRLVQAKRRSAVIIERIAAERAKVGADGVGKKDFAALAADYERLLVDREFAEKAYITSLSTYDSAKAESQRTSRYLAAHILPTKAEVSRYPERLALLGLMALFLGLIWSIAVLISYSLKDRR
jgi:capsular polysaccharide transport system permease protein